MIGLKFQDVETCLTSQRRPVKVEHRKIWDIHKDRGDLIARMDSKIVYMHDRVYVEEL
jgi:hypothetical protein